MDERKHYTGIPYKLEQHLKEMCEEHEEYKDLHATCQINRKIMSEALKNVAMNFPHYSQHDSSHSEKIITNIEMLLGEEAIHKLSPTDTWMLLQAAYMHDLGMLLVYGDIETRWKTEEFQQYLSNLTNSLDTFLQEGAKAILRITQKGAKEEDLTWPLELRRYVTAIVANFYRGRHAQMSKNYLREEGKKLGIDLTNNSLIPTRFFDMLGEVSYLHNENEEKVLELDYLSNGYSADYMHPRFIAEMIRVGDLLDLDNHRFNAFTELVFGELPDSSKVHVKKHRATKHILITPQEIEFRANCEDAESYRETRNVINWLEQEMQFLALNWNIIMPEEIKGTAPKLKKTELLLRGIPDVRGLSDLRFQISQEKAFDIIEGSNLYEEPLIFVREVIQNAADASKVQLWRDIKAQKYDAWLSTKEYSKLEPYDINREIFSNYTITVEIVDCGEEIEVQIRDKGIGITTETLAQMCKVGESYHIQKQRKNEIKEMPSWLRPTSGFGIGLQSVFLVADSFEIYTNTTEDGPLKITFQSRKSQGYVQVNETDEDIPYGSKLVVKIAKGRSISMSHFGRTRAYYSNEFDPFAGSSNKLLSYNLLDVIMENCSPSFFPVQVVMDGQEERTIEMQEIQAFRKDNNETRHRFDKDEKGGIYCEIWNTKYKAYGKYQLMPTDSHLRSELKFKGMQLDKFNPQPNLGLKVCVDLYGLDTKEYVTLNRTSIRKEKQKDVREILEEMYQEYLGFIWEYIHEMPEEEWKEYAQEWYFLWRILTTEKKDKLMTEKGFTDNVNHEVLCMKIGDKVADVRVDFKELYQKREECFLLEGAGGKLDRFYNNAKKGMKLIQKAIKKHKEKLPCKYVILSDEFGNAISDYGKSRVVFIREGKDSYTFTDWGGNHLLQIIHQEDREKYLHDLAREKAEEEHYVKPKRSESFAIADYPMLAVNAQYNCIEHHDIYTMMDLISPMLNEDEKLVAKCEKEEFIQTIMKREAFDNLISYILERQEQMRKKEIWKTFYAAYPQVYTREEIAKGYERLIGEYYEVVKGKQ